MSVRFRPETPFLISGITMKSVVPSVTLSLKITKNPLDAIAAYESRYCLSSVSSISVTSQSWLPLYENVRTFHPATFYAYCPNTAMAVLQDDTGICYARAVLYRSSPDEPYSQYGVNYGYTGILDNLLRSQNITHSYHSLEEWKLSTDFYIKATMFEAAGHVYTTVALPFFDVMCPVWYSLETKDEEPYFKFHSNPKKVSGLTLYTGLSHIGYVVGRRDEMGAE